MNIFDEDTLQNLYDLVQRETSCQDGSEELEFVFRQVVEKLQCADSMFFVTKKDVDKKISGFIDKFLLHGCVKEAERMKHLYDKLFEKKLPKEEFQNILTAMQFLFSLSTKPEIYLPGADTNSDLQPVPEEEINWGEYLLDGIDRWSPTFGSDSDISSDDDTQCSTSIFNESDTNTQSQDLPLHIKPVEEFNRKVFNARKCQQQIMSSVQNTWFNKDVFREIPESTHPYAVVALDWEDYLQDVTMCLVNVKSNMVSEYKIIREVIKQFSGQSNGVAFVFSGDQLIPNPKITIPSCRPEATQKFISIFLPAINTLHKFREFEETIIESDNFSVPYTYRSYCNSLKNILKPVMDDIINIEADVVKQETTITLLKLYEKCHNSFEILNILNNIHSKVIISTKTYSNLQCATHLLTTLYKSLQSPSTVLEQNIHLTIYLESLYSYLTIIHNWLDKWNFKDLADEFPVQKTNYSKENCLMEFCDKTLIDAFVLDTFIQTVCTRVVQIGRNIHLLHLLGKFHLLTFRMETLYEDYTDNVLKRLSSYFGKNIVTPNISSDCIIDLEEKWNHQSYKFPAICADFCKVPTEKDRLENLVDTSNVFLMKAFEGFFMDLNTQRINGVDEDSLYKKIMELTPELIPVKIIIGDIFPQILEERYSESERILKQVIRNDYKFDEIMNLLWDIYLYKNDILFPLYRRLFTKIQSNNKCETEVRLTTYLQDILVDFYPEHYSEVRIAAENGWENSIGQPTNQVQFTIKCKINWPINIIIKDEHIQMYEEIFFFIFQLKWALFALNHLDFKDIKGTVEKTTQMQMKIHRFCLINLFSSIQHYVLGHLFPKCFMEYEVRYEKAFNMDSLIDCHDNFITTLHKHAIYIRDLHKESYGFFLLLRLVNNLVHIWNKPEDADSSKLEKRHNLYKITYKKLSKIVFPVNDIFSTNSN